MFRFLLFALVAGLASAAQYGFCAENPLPDEATVTKWIEDLQGADENRQREAAARIEETCKFSRWAFAEIGELKAAYQALMAQQENLHREINRRSEQLDRAKNTIVKQEQQLHAARLKEYLDVEKQLKAAAEGIRKSGDVVEKAALLEVEKQKLNQVIAQQRHVTDQLLRADFEGAMDHQDTWRRLYELVMETRLKRAMGKPLELAPDLTRLLSSPDWSVRAKAAHWLWLLEPPPHEALPALKEALKDRWGFVRALAAAAVWRIERKTDAVLPVLLELLESDALARHSSAEVVGRIAREEPTVADPLAKLLGHADEDVACEAGWALRRMGPAAKAAVPALEAAAKDQRARVREAAEQALREVNQQKTPKSSP